MTSGSEWDHQRRNENDFHLSELLKFHRNGLFLRQLGGKKEDSQLKTTASIHLSDSPQFKHLTKSMKNVFFFKGIKPIKV